MTTDRRVMPIDGIYNIRHLKKTVSTTVLDIFTELFPTSAPDAIFHLRVVVTDGGAARFNVNGCATTTDANNGIFVDFEHPIDLDMLRIDNIKAVRTGAVDATCEILAWW